MFFTIGSISGTLDSGALNEIGPNVSIGRAKYVDKNEVDSEQRIRKKEKEVGLPPYDVYSVTIEILLSLT